MAECENKGCIRIKKNEEIDIPLDNTDLLYCPDEEVPDHPEQEVPGHPEYVWRVKNTTNQNGFIIAAKEGYTNPAGTPEIDTLTATRGEWICKAGKYVFPADDDPQRQTRQFKIYGHCRDRKCRRT